MSSTLWQDMGEGGGGGGWVPFLKFTWTHMQTARGCVTQSSPKADLGFTDMAGELLRSETLDVVTNRSRKNNYQHSNSYPLAYLSDIHTLLCDFTGSFIIYIIVGDVTDSAYSFPVSSVCVEFCSESSVAYPIWTLCIVLWDCRNLTITVYTLNKSKRRILRYHRRYSSPAQNTSTVNPMWKTMEDSFRTMR